MKKFMLSFVVSSVACWALFAGETSAGPAVRGVAHAVLYVDAKAGPGGDGSQARPFASPHEAVEAARKACGAASRPHGSAAVSIRLAEGDYHLPTPLELDKRDGNLEFAGVGRVRLLRAEKLSPQPKPGASNVLTCAVACDAGDPPAAEGFGSVRPHLPLFFYDGQWAVEARWPNEGFATFTEAVDTGIRGRCLNSIAPDNPTVAGSFRFDDARAATWDYANGVWLCGYFTHDWSWERIRAAGYDARQKVMKMAAPATFGIAGQSWTSEPARRFYVVGAKSELDAVGEYYFDRKTKVVDFIMPAGMKEFLAVTKPGWLVTVTDAENVRFKNICFEYALEGAVSVKNCRDLEIADCRIGNVGGDALRIEGGANCRVVRTTIAGCGCSGVAVSGGDRRKLVPANHVVTGCDIRDFGRLNRTYSPGIHVWGVGITLSDNKIHDAPHTGILYWGNDHRIERNEIWGLLYECGDAGAVYTGRDPTSRGNLLQFNYIHDCGHRGRKTANMMGFYIDDCDCGDTFVSNRVVNVPRGLLLGGGQDNHILGNTFEQCDVGLSIDNRGVYDTGKFDSTTDKSWQMTRKVKEMPVDEEPWKSRYPLLATYLFERPREPLHNSIVGNTFKDCNQPIEYWLEGNPKNRDDLDMRDNRFVNEKLFKFPRATPESVGIPSASVQKLIDKLEAEGDWVHSYMLIRHGKVVAEGWWAPYDAATRHALFSVSKSFVAMAMGLAIEDRKITINDRINWFYPECVPTNQHEWAKEIRIRDLMSMASGQQNDSLGAVLKEGPKGFFSVPMGNPPGLLFRYMNGNTSMLAEIHRKVTGVNDLMNYLYPRVFDKMGFGDFYWERQPDGTVLGCAGFELQTEDLAKVCQLLLQGGRWQGERLLPLWWVKQATSCQTPYGQVLDPILAKHIGVKDDTMQANKANDWEVGYGYQLWMGTHETFRLCGAYGQIGIVMPDKDIVFVSYAGGNGANAASVSAFYDAILPTLQDEPLPEDPAAVAALRKRSANLTLSQYRAKVAPSAKAKAVAAKGCALAPNKAEVKRIRFEADRRVVEIENNFGVQRVPVAEEGWAKSWFTAHTHEPETIGRLPGGAQPVGAQGVWYTPEKFGFRVAFTRSPYYIDVELDCSGETMQVVSFCPTAGRYSNVRDRQTREIELDDYWLNVDCKNNGWDEQTGFKVYIDGREEFCVYEPIGGSAKHVYAFDVRRFQGKTARIVATAQGTFENVALKSATVTAEPAANAVVKTTPIGDCVPAAVRLARKADAKFLYVPIKRDAAPVLCTVWDGAKAVFDLRLRLAADGKGDFFASIPLDGFTADTVQFTTRMPVVPKAASLAKFFAVGTVVRAGDPNIVRPKLHFSAPFGGSGDMVGFFRQGETYHMGYLHDYGYDIWNENCCWSHATSTDFFNWQAASAYDRKGGGMKRSSGCCFVDTKNASGLGDGKTPPVLLFGCLENQYAQRWQKPRYSRSTGSEERPDLLPRMGLKVLKGDGTAEVGRAHGATERELFRLNAIGGHDPEVVYDAAHDTYVMVVHDRRDGKWGFDFYVSKNLLDWNYASTVPGMWETPNFYPLVCEGKTYWVLQQCQLEYRVGTFDGRIFTPEGKLNSSFKGAFAPRTFETSDGRRVLLAARLEAGPTGGATLPMEVKLVKTAEGLRLAYAPVREIAKYAAQVTDTTIEILGDTWEVAGRKGKFLEGEPHIVRTIVDGPVTDFFVGWGVVAGTVPSSAE